MKIGNIKELRKVSSEVRLKVLDVVYKTPGGHIGGSYSVIDILVVLYYNIMKHDPKNSGWIDRDYLILSKGHCCLALYAVLEKTGYFNETFLQSYCHNGGLLGGHPKKGDAPGIEATTGSLGHGLSIGCGIALAHKISTKTNRIFVIMGDGEMNEGSVWEGLMFASQQKLNNLTIVIDNNRLESLDLTNNILSIEPLEERLTSFGWNVARVDGHNHGELCKSLSTLFNTQDKPVAIIADTTKGKGVSFMENVPMWHHRKLKDDEYKNAKLELEQDRRI
jgi:transketolase